MNTLLSIRVAIILVIITIVLYTFYLIRHKRLSIHLAISWIIVEIVLLIVTSVSTLTTKLTSLIGETNFYSLIFLFLIAWIVSLMLDTLKRVSDIMQKTLILTQENGLLREKVERLEEKINTLARNKNGGNTFLRKNQTKGTKHQT